MNNARELLASSYTPSTSPSTGFYVGLAFGGFFILLVVALLIYRLCNRTQVVAYPQDQMQGQDTYWQVQPGAAYPTGPYPQQPYAQVQPYQQYPYPLPDGHQHPPWGAPVIGMPVAQPIPSATVQIGGEAASSEQQPPRYPGVKPQGAE